MGPARANIIEEGGCLVRVVHLDRVEQARDNAIAEREVERLSRIHKVLGDPNRLKIVMALRNVEMCVCDLAAFTGLSESAVSHQLRRMKDLSLVKKRRAGQILYYSLDDDYVARVLNLGLEHVRDRYEVGSRKNSARDNEQSAKRKEI